MRSSDGFGMNSNPNPSEKPSDINVTPGVVVLVELIRFVRVVVWMCFLAIVVVPSVVEVARVVAGARYGS